MVNVKERFSKNLFWDVDVSQLDVDANRRYVIGRVLDRGTDNDLRLALFGEASAKAGLPVNPAFGYQGAYIELVQPLMLTLPKPKSEEALQVLFVGTNLTVKTGSGADLVASKLYRYSEQDQEDIQFLMLRGGVTLDVVLPKYRVPEF